MEHFKQLFVYILIFVISVITNALADDAAAQASFAEKIATILNSVEENKDDGFCCTPLNHIISKDVPTKPACKDIQDECAAMTCELEHSGVMMNNVIDEDKCKKELVEVWANNPDVRPMADTIKEGCFNGTYKEFTWFKCPAMQLYFCYYILGSISCPQNGCDQSTVCKDTCDKFQQIKSIIIN